MKYNNVIFSINGDVHNVLYELVYEQENLYKYYRINDRLVGYGNIILKDFLDAVESNFYVINLKETRKNKIKNFLK